MTLSPPEQRTTGDDTSYSGPVMSFVLWTNEEICKSQGTYNSTMSCCSNKCVDVAYDNDNCGACKNKCTFTQTCCRGECVYLAYDKRHCGECNHSCLVDEFCVYGLCNYA
ncbi:PREDICTED: stigma-specific STIG1-like protein 3 [Camelina sativa]|uniref:Stigma-specific STIG1-like protein 3 n=1 Tax=Camelina sativa TaxID=90675 RepID=A0ABM0X5P8_CAMSA|nr:PREDICTED: stigma-specific STIG1-like protein 3 [Camelina sativa]